MPTLVNILSDAEKKALRSHEKTIEKGLDTFFEVGKSLLAIREERLYLESHDTFDAYCRERWSMDRTYAHRTIAAYDVCDSLSGKFERLPATESQARPLVKFPADKRRTVWERVLKSAGSSRVTAQMVADAIGADKSAKKPSKPDTKRLVDSVRNAEWSDEDLNELERVVTSLIEKAVKR